MPGSSLDSNVLIYIASGDTKKADRAEAVVAAGGAISVQVLNEVTNVARRKMQMDWADTHAFLDMLCRLLKVLPVNLEIHKTGLRLGERYGLSVYDSMIAAATLCAGCTTLWSEDMQHGMTLEGALRIANPFHDASRA